MVEAAIFPSEAQQAGGSIRVNTDGSTSVEPVTAKDAVYKTQGGGVHRFIVGATTVLVLDEDGIGSLPGSLAITGPSPWIDVTALGADNTGVADSWATIQGAINSIPVGKGGVIFIPQGKYKLTQTLLFPDDRWVYLKGIGSGRLGSVETSLLIQNTGATGPIISMATVGDGSYFKHTVEGLQLQGAATGSHGIEVKTRIRRVYLVDLAINLHASNMDGACIYNNKSFYMDLRNCFLDGGGYGIYILNGSNIWIRNISNFGSNTGFNKYCIYTETVGGGELSGTMRFEDIKFNAPGDLGGFYFKDTDNCRVDNVNIENVTGINPPTFYKFENCDNFWIATSGGDIPNGGTDTVSFIGCRDCHLFGGLYKGIIRIDANCEDTHLKDLIFEAAGDYVDLGKSTEIDGVRFSTNSFRPRVDPQSEIRFHYDGIGSNVNLDLNPTGFGLTGRYIPFRNGELLGFSAYLTEARTAGSVLIRPIINGILSNPQMTLDASFPQKKQVRCTARRCSFLEGDAIQFRVTPDASFLPISANINIVAYVRFSGAYTVDS